MPMADSDEPRDDDALEGVGFEGEFVEPGPRRSTYTPPVPSERSAPPTYSLDDVPFVEPQSAPPVFNPPPFDDDDSPYSSDSGYSESTVYSLDDPVAGPSPFAPPGFSEPTFSPESAASWAPPPFDPPPVAPPAATDEQLAAAPPPVFERPVEAEAPVAAPAFDPSAWEAPRAEASAGAPPAWPLGEPTPATNAAPEPDEPAPVAPEELDLSAFAPPRIPHDSEFPGHAANDSADPSFPSAEEQARLLAQHAGPTSRPWIPERRSLSDEELAAELSAELSESSSQPGAVLDVMAELERQLYLRTAEAREYQDWEQSMLSIGTPEALAAVDQVRPRFEDVVALTSSIPIQYPDAAQPEAESPVAEPLAEPPVASPDLGPEPAAEPAPDPIPPTDPTAFDPFDFTALPVATPPALIEPPEPDTVTPLFVEPVLAPAFSFDDLLAPDPDQQVDVPTPPTPDPFDMTALPTALATAPPTFVPTPVPNPIPDAIPDAVVEPEPPAAPSSRRTAIATESVAAAGLAAEPVAGDGGPGGAVAHLWLWFAANASVISVALGGVLLSLGMSVRQAVIATLIGLLLSAIPLSVGVLSSRRSGRSTMIVSRATFGVTGNIVPALLALVTRVLWGAVVLWALATSVASALAGAGFDAGLGHDQLVLVSLAAGILVALVLASLGFRVLATFQLVVSVVSLVLIVGLIVLTAQHVKFETALAVQDGPLTLIITGAVLVFSVVGLVWANSAGDLSVVALPGRSRTGAPVFAALATTLPALVLVSYGSLLAASDPAFAKGLLSDPVDALGRLLPSWYPIPLLAAVVLGLLSAVVVTISSGSRALTAAGVRLSPVIGAVLVAVLIVAFGWLISTSGSGAAGLVRDLATTMAVPTAAWLGLFAGDTLLRHRPLYVPSLATVGGSYPRVRWLNLVALVVVTALGWGLTTAGASGLGWQGYLFRLGGVTGELSASDVGVILALVLGVLVALGFGARDVRAQEALEAPLERAEVDAPR